MRELLRRGLILFVLRGENSGEKMIKRGWWHEADPQLQLVGDVSPEN